MKPRREKRGVERPGSVKTNRKEAAEKKQPKERKRDGQREPKKERREAWDKSVQCFRKKSKSANFT